MICIFIMINKFTKRNLITMKQALAISKWQHIDCEQVGFSLIFGKILISHCDVSESGWGFHYSAPSEVSGSSLIFYIFPLNDNIENLIMFRITIIYSLIIICWIFFMCCPSILVSENAEVIKTALCLIYFFH